MLAVLVATAHPVEATTTSGITTPLPSPSHRATYSFRPWTSADGRYVAFDSDSPTLVAADTNRARDIFVYDRARGITTRVSVGVNGDEANGDSQRPTLSADGRYVAFWSKATNLVEGDANGVADAFVYDRTNRITHRVSVGPGGVEANGESARPVISADGRYVAFESAATNLTPPDLLGRPTDTNRARDVFVHDLVTRETTRVSVASNGAQGTGESVRPAISADGRYVAFHSSAAFDPADTNDARDVYVHDRVGGATTRVSVSTGGAAGNGGSFSPAISADGRWVAFWSNAGNLVEGDFNRKSDIFVRDRQQGTTVRVSVASDGTEANGESSDPSISPDGRWVAFWSRADNLVPGDTNGVRDVFLHDRHTSRTVRVSVASDGTEADGDSYSPSVNATGSLVAFDSSATTLVREDTNGGSHIFVHTASR